MEEQRAVLVPTLRAAGSGVVVAQTRGTDFVEWCAQQQGKYEVDTIQKDGSVQTQELQLEGASVRGFPSRAKFRGADEGSC